MSRMLLVLIMLAVTAGAVVAYKDPERVARASDTLSEVMRERSLSTSRAVQIARAQNGEFALRARINGVVAPMADESAIDEAPPLQPETAGPATPEERLRVRHKPIMSAGTRI